MLVLFSYFFNRLPLLAFVAVERRLSIKYSLQHSTTFCFKAPVVLGVGVGADKLSECVDILFTLVTAECLYLLFFLFLTLWSLFLFLEGLLYYFQPIIQSLRKSLTVVVAEVALVCLNAETSLLYFGSS